MTETSEITRPILLFLQRLPHIIVWRANVGRRGKILFGRPGQGDISGLLAPLGRRVEIETKTPAGELSDRQKAFRSDILAMGGVYVILLSLQDAVAWARSEGLIRCLLRKS